MLDCFSDGEFLYAAVLGLLLLGRVQRDDDIFDPFEGWLVVLLGIDEMFEFGLGKLPDADECLPRADLAGSAS